MRTRWWVTLGVLGIAGAAVLGVLTARHDAAHAFSEEAPQVGALRDLVPSHPGTVFYPMGNDVRVDGVSREMAYALTPDSPSKVADRYEAIWRSQGLRVDRKSVGSEEWVSAYAPGDTYLRTIAASKTADMSAAAREAGLPPSPRDDRTVIIASVRPMWAEPQGPGIPLPEQCRAVTHSGSRDRGLLIEMVAASCEGHAQDVIDYYDDMLADAKRSTPAASERGSFITYSAEGIDVTLAVQESDTPPVRTAITVTWQEQTR